MKQKSLKHAASLVILAIIGLVIFGKTFQLEIFGDEWEGIWWTTSTLQRTGHFNDRVDYKPYETAATLLNIVSRASSLNYDSTAVYIFSFITRLLAAYSLYYFLIRRKLSYVASFTGALMFLITPIGIQATDWAKNFTSYISIAFFLICLDSIYKIRSWIKILIFLTTFSLSIYVNPIRAHGIIFTTVFLVLFQMLFSKSVKKVYKIFLPLSIFSILFIFSRGMVFANSDIFKSVITQKLIDISTQILSGNLRRLNDVFLLIGRGLIPQPSLIYILLLVTVLLFWKKHLFKEKYFLFVLFGHFILFSIFKYKFVLAETNTIILGIYFSIFIITTFFIELFNKKIPAAFNTILPFLLNATFIIIPWILGNTDITESTHRYLIYPALSVPIIIAFFVNTYISSDLKRVLIMPFKLSAISLFISLLFFVMFVFSSKSEISDMYKRHNQNNAKIIWQQIAPYFDGVDFNNHRPIILFESDNPAVLQDSVLFGINYRLGFLYKVWNEDKLPIPLDGIGTLKSMLTDGKASKRYTGRELIFSKEDAYYFRIIKNVVYRVDISEMFTKNQIN